jgi:hypothetical protein
MKEQGRNVEMQRGIGAKKKGARLGTRRCWLADALIRVPDQSASSFLAQLKL